MKKTPKTPSSKSSKGEKKSEKGKKKSTQGIGVVAPKSAKVQETKAVPPITLGHVEPFPNLGKHKGKKDKKKGKGPNLKRLQDKLREAVTVLQSTGDDLAEIAPVLERLSNWVHKNTWDIQRHRLVGQALATKYKALIDGGVPKELAHELMLILLKDKAGQDPVGTVLGGSAAMGPLGMQLASMFRGGSSGEHADGQGVTVLRFPGGDSPDGYEPA